MPAIGIDLGTTCSVVAARVLGEIQVLKDSNGHKTTPSYVAMHDTMAHAQCGHAAKANQRYDVKNTLFNIKRLIGRDYHKLKSELHHFPFAVIDNGCDEPVIESTRGHFMTPEEASAILLKHLKCNAEVQLGCTVHDAVITVPAHFGDKQRQATRRAAELAGLNVLRIVNEPTAAAIAHGIHHRKKSAEEKELRILVFDYGGGTLDVTVIILDGNGIFEVLSSGGDSRLGGEDVDASLADYCISKNNWGCVERNVKIQIEHACEAAKRQLSTSDRCDICISELNLTCSITRAELEDINMHHFQKCFDIVRSVLAKSRLSPADIDEIVLVGGSSRIPRVQTLLSELFENKKPLEKRVDPDEAVALGAAILADMLEPSSSSLSTKMNQDVLLLDVTPLSLGFELEDSLMKVVVPSNHTIPTRKHQFVSTCYDDQEYVTIKIFEGERAKTENCHHLKSLTLGPLTKAPAGTPRIKLSFDVDANCILTVTAQDENEPTISKTIKVHENFNDAVIHDMKKDARLNLDADMAEQRRHFAKTDLATACKNVLNQVKNIQERDQVQQTLAWLHANPDASPDAYQQRLEHILSMKTFKSSVFAKLAKI